MQRHTVNDFKHTTLSVRNEEEYYTFQSATNWTILVPWPQYWSQLNGLQPLSLRRIPLSRTLQVIDKGCEQFASGISLEARLIIPEESDTALLHISVPQSEKDVFVDSVTLYSYSGDVYEIHLRRMNFLSRPLAYSFLYEEKVDKKYYTGTVTFTPWQYTGIKCVYRFFPTYTSTLRTFKPPRGTPACKILSSLGNRALGHRVRGTEHVKYTVQPIKDTTVVRETHFIRKGLFDPRMQRSGTDNVTISDVCSPRSAKYQYKILSEIQILYLQ